MHPGETVLERGYDAEHQGCRLSVTQKSFSTNWTGIPIASPAADTRA